MEQEQPVSIRQVVRVCNQLGHRVSPRCCSSWLQMLRDLWILDDRCYGIEIEDALDDDENDYVIDYDYDIDDAILVF